jgi:hypothetical protein
MKKDVVVRCVMFCVLAFFAFGLVGVVLRRADYFGVEGVASVHEDLPDQIRGFVPVGATDIRYWAHSANGYIRFQADEETFSEWVQAKGFERDNRISGLTHYVGLIEHPEVGLEDPELVEVSVKHIWQYRQSNGGGYTVGYIPEQRLVIFQMSTH